MEAYDGQLYKDQDVIRRLLALMEQAVKDDDGLLILACAGELMERVGDAYFFHGGGRSAQIEVTEFLRELRYEQAPLETEKDHAISARLESAFTDS